MKNPFKFDIEVAGDFFCGRQKEIREIVEAIKNETNIIMFAKRRIGKSSLLKEIFTHHLDDKILRSHIDIYSISNVKELYLRLLRGIEQSLIGHESNINRLSRWVESLQNYFSHAKVSIILSGTPQLKIESEETDYFVAIEQLLQSYYQFLTAHKRQAVIAIDEFQKIVSLKQAEKIEQLLRTLVNKRQNTAFIFTGSKRNILLAMFNDATRAFFKLGSEFALPPISKNEFFVWVKQRFAKKKIQIHKAAFDHLYQMADGETRFIQQICYEAFRSYHRNDWIDISVIDSLTKQVISKKTYNAQLLNRFTSSQQTSLKIIAINNGYNIYASDLIAEGIINKATLQSSVRSLVKDGIIFQEKDQLVFEDIEFKLWLQFDSGRFN